MCISVRFMSILERFKVSMASDLVVCGPDPDDHDEDDSEKENVGNGVSPRLKHTLLSIL